MSGVAQGAKILSTKALFSKLLLRTQFIEQIKACVTPSPPKGSFILTVIGVSLSNTSECQRANVRAV